MTNKELSHRDWKDFFRNKRITLMGLGLLGRGVGDAEFLAKYARDITVTDLKSKRELESSLPRLKKYRNIKYRLGGHNFRDFKNRDFILKAAGVPLDSPYIMHAQQNGVPVYMSTALFARLSGIETVGITGTRGKTTVTHMIYAILRSYFRNKNKKVFLGGNVEGISTLALLPKVKKGDVAVLELDSWQLQGFGDLKISPNVSIFTTFMPDHLNYYKGNLKTYFLDKIKIFEFQGNGGIAVAGEQICSLPSSFTRHFPSHTKFVSEKLLPKNFRLKVVGDHNRYNAGIAFAVARAMDVPKNIVLDVLRKFRGVTGRLERIGIYKGMPIYNDTTSTTPEALIAALSALGKRRNISLIMGGSDKSLNLRILRAPLKEKCVSVALLKGTGTDRLIKEKIVDKNVNYKIFSDLRDAFNFALRNVTKNNVILFSPGFASFGMFKNEYERGEVFNQLVKKLR